MRYHTLAEVSPLVGMVNEPPFAPVVSREERMGMFVVVEDDPPGECARGEHTVLGIGRRTGVGNGLPRRSALLPWVR